MPQVMKVDGFTFHMYPNDHPPPHVHVCQAGTWCVVLLGSADDPASLRENVDMKPIDARRAVWLVASARELLLARWRKLYAQP
ncbi:MAG TPA: DUF4160 domain-containing protein [Longimicrobium sp.]|nr:DUF4160 domain-containing protein [Longimicrobium sp.]